MMNRLFALLATLCLSAVLSSVNAVDADVELTRPELKEMNKDTARQRRRKLTDAYKKSYKKDSPTHEKEKDPSNKAPYYSPYYSPHYSPYYSPYYSPSYGKGDDGKGKGSYDDGKGKGKGSYDDGKGKGKGSKSKG